MDHLNNPGKNKAWQRLFSPLTGILFTSLLTVLLLSACSQGTAPTTSGGPNITTTLRLTSIAMLNANNGWALTRQSILSTTDGGVHWKDVSPANLSTTLGNQGTGGLRDGAFSNASTAWVSLVTSNSAIQILHTVDGGQHWDTATIPGSGSPDRAHFINAQDGWIEIHRDGAAGSEEVDIYQTTDGGQTWNKASGTGNTSAGLLPFNGHKTGISFKDANTGWATGESAATGSFWLYITHDGGKTWQYQAPELPTNATNVTIGTTPPVFFGNTGFLPVSVNTNSSQTEILYVTHDGGATWQITPSLPGDTSNIYVFDAQHAWANQGNKFYATSDGEQHWVTYTSSIQNGVSSMSFVSSTTGWAIGNSDTNEPLLFKTTDGGQTWMKISYTIG